MGGHRQLARGRQSLEALIGTMKSIDDRVHYAMVAGTVQPDARALLIDAVRDVLRVYARACRGGGQEEEET